MLKPQSRDTPLCWNKSCTHPTYTYMYATLPLYPHPPVPAGRSQFWFLLPRAGSTPS